MFVSVVSNMSERKNPHLLVSLYTDKLKPLVGEVEESVWCCSSDVGESRFRMVESHG